MQSRLADVSLPSKLGPVGGTAALSPDGRLLAAADMKGGIQLFDVSDLRHPVPLGSPLRGAVPLVEVMAFTPDGKVLAEGDDSGEVRLAASLATGVPLLSRAFLMRRATTPCRGRAGHPAPELLLTGQPGNTFPSAQASPSADDPQATIR